MAVRKLRLSRAAAGIATAVLLLTVACASGSGVSGPPSSTPARNLTAVVIGDSIAYGQEDCDNCSTFIDLYAASLSQRLGYQVTSENFSTHDGLTGAGLVERLKSEEMYRDAVGRADILVISILHNDTPWASDTDPCDRDKGDPIDFRKYTTPCVTAAAAKAVSELEQVFTETAALRGGKPTVQVVPAIFNDWIELGPTPADTITKSKFVLDIYAAQIRKATTASGSIYLDVYHDFNGTDGLKPVGDLASDLTHPSAKGHQRIAQLLEQVDVSAVTIR